MPKFHAIALGQIFLDIAVVFLHIVMKSYTMPQGA